MLAAAGEEPAVREPDGHLTLGIGRDRQRVLERDGRDVASVPLLQVASQGQAQVVTTRDRREQQVAGRPVDLQAIHDLLQEVRLDGQGFGERRRRRLRPRLPPLVGEGEERQVPPPVRVLRIQPDRLPEVREGTREQAVPRVDETGQGRLRGCPEHGGAPDGLAQLLQAPEEPGEAVVDARRSRAHGKALRVGGVGDPVVGLGHGHPGLGRGSQAATVGTGPEAPDARGQLGRHLGQRVLDRGASRVQTGGLAEVVVRADEVRHRDAPGASRQSGGTLIVPVGDGRRDDGEAGQDQDRHRHPAAQESHAPRGPRAP